MSTKLFETSDKGNTVRAMQDGDRIVLQIEIGDDGASARLPLVQAVALAVGILHANLPVLARYAELLADEDGAALGMVLLAPAARRSLEREAAKTMPETMN
jgi:hypothetical protein